MLTNIRSAGEPSNRSANEDAASMLLGCHQRIRHFTEVAVRLAENPSAAATERSNAAKNVFRYYSEALPLHEADENDSLHPRLRQVLPEGILAEANRVMVQQHTEIDALVSGLIPLWDQIQKNPSSQAPDLLSQTQRLQQLWTSHLQLEEEQVIPAMRRFLSESDLHAIEAEMRARRQR
jgi:hemerythrin-like domain-containing protein